MSKLDLFAAVILSLSACSLAIAAPVPVATNSTLNAGMGDVSAQKLAYSAGPCGVCGASIMPTVGAAITSTEAASQAANWLTDAHGTVWADGSSDVPTPQVTLDFVRTIDVSSVIVWRENTLAREDASVRYRTRAARLNFSFLAWPDWSPGTGAYSGLNIVERNIGVQFSKLPGTWALAADGSLNGPATSSHLGPVIGLLVPGILIAAGLLLCRRAN